MNWQNKDKIIAMLRDVAAFIMLCVVTYAMLIMLAGCTSAPAHTVDNTTVTTEMTRTEYAPDGSVAAVEVHKEIVKNNVVTEMGGAAKEKKKGGVPWLVVFMAVSICGGFAFWISYKIRRRNL